MYGTHSRALYAVWSNPAPGVDLERFREYYEDVHRPDTLAIGHFDRSFRYVAHGPALARYLTLWEAEYADLPSALERVRKGALALREQGRIWPVQEVVFHQFAFAPGPCDAVAEAPVATLSTVQNDWSAPARGESVHDWARGALPDERSLAARYAARYLYAAPHATDSRAGRFFWLGESSQPASELAALWRARAQSGLAPLGRPVPIFPPPEGDSDGLRSPAARCAKLAGPDHALSDAAGAAWVTHWTPTGAP